jgi:multicomponent Na+:H+ antiporter subunit B
MKWVYIVAGVALYFKVLVMPNPEADLSNLAIVKSIVQDSGVPNTVAGIIFRNRLYDTIFEVVVFTIAILGAQFLLANEKPIGKIRQFSDHPSIVLARLGAITLAIVSIELAIRGHISPGGGFAAGVGGGTAIGLVTITASLEWLHGYYQRWYTATWEKVAVLIFIFLSIFTLVGWELPHGELGALASGGAIPLLNILVTVKVALGSWAVTLLFMRHRGLL